jgi:ABC-type glutathione transport system ATPase component
MEDSADATSATEPIERNLEELARQLTHKSQNITDELQPYNPEPGSHLDPQSPSFNARAWVKAFVKLSETDPSAASSRFLGVAFKTLGAYGWSTGAESQPTVTNIALRAVTSLAGLIGGRRQGKRIDILRDFEGVIKEGELLLVLGPPGSGCSTFLKTLTGETSGFKIAENSYLNYRGNITLLT